MVNALIFLQVGFEEIEFASIVDILRRCNIEVTSVSLQGDIVEGAHGIKIVADKTFGNVRVEDFDVVITVGGTPGTDNLRKDERVKNALKESAKLGKLTAAICATPSILSEIGLLKGKNCTIYPGMENLLKKGGCKFKKNALVVVDGKIITSRGPATSIPFALKIAEKLTDRETVKNVKKKVLADLSFK